MKKEIIIFIMLTTIMLVAISLATAVNTVRPVERKESPLYKIRANRAVDKGHLNQIREKFYTRFINSNRLFFNPFMLFRNGAFANEENLRLYEPTYPNKPSWPVSYDTCSKPTFCCECK